MSLDGPVLNVANYLIEKKRIYFTDASPLFLLGSISSMASQADDIPPPEYAENDTDKTVPQALAELTVCGDDSSVDSAGKIKAYSLRISQINERLREIGYDTLDHPINCPTLLMEYEDSRRSWRAPFVDSGNYVIKLGRYLDAFRKSESVLASKLKEVEDMKIEKSDITDFIWKEERDGIVYRTNLKSYYESHKIALNNLVTFIETATPVDGKLVFQEKNKLVAEKLDLLLKMRGLQLLVLPEGSSAECSVV
jgi:hypothetical protein